ncbi:hydroxymethylglutaryl-CoA lyase [Rhabdobacter roseus]|uniref:Hydroxymethylglutaryl-CoA lyase n=1 Tax=Rhabdobacter roseus TaxID=1655419 RepID=A0A840TTA5_9BACT|nr:hydroxymethylglutaryl-CoA lyase [Rhabdobacter roseus]MBB5284503.1 hydroxymethylglutaryl-CoA lyase [Rhabdobacter roseus]
MKIIECPRDAWQGYLPFIPTEEKIKYLSTLLRVGFDTIDLGSFVSPRAMPQVRDTAEVLRGLDRTGTSSRLLAIVANERGAQEACQFDALTYLGYPFSISETFQRRNTNATIEASVGRVEAMQVLCEQYGKELVIYISMGFGNPYGDPWAPEVALEWIEKLAALGIRTFSLSDTVGVATPETITELFTGLLSTPESRTALEFGAHFHTTPQHWREKVAAAYAAGCRRFDGALLGYGGCPMAQDELVGNMPTENLVAFAQEKGEALALDEVLLAQARQQFAALVQ